LDLLKKAIGSLTLEDCYQLQKLNYVITKIITQSSLWESANKLFSVMIILYCLVKFN